MNNVYDMFIHNTKKLIEEKGYKQIFIAKKINVTEKQLSDMLNHRRKIDLYTISLLCNALEVSPNELFGYKSA